MKNERVAQQWQVRESTPEYLTPSAYTPSPSDMGRGFSFLRLDK
jgi:hypothetical protein